MPISFECACGRAFSVGDEYAGKRAKCPRCGAPITVPSPAPEPDALSDEDKAFQALEDAPDTEPSSAPARAPAEEQSPRSGRPAPAPIPAATRGPKYESQSPARRERSERAGTSGIHITPGVLGGLFSMLIGGVWFVLALSGDRISIFAPIVFLSGLVAVVRGLLGYSEE